MPFGSGELVVRPDSAKTGRHVSSAQFASPKTHRNAITIFSFSRSSVLHIHGGSEQPKTNSLKKTLCRIYGKHTNLLTRRMIDGKNWSVPVLLVLVFRFVRLLLSGHQAVAIENTALRIGCRDRG